MMKKSTILYGTLGILGAIAVWQFVATIVSDNTMASPLQTVTAMFEAFRDVTFWSSVWVTIQMAVIGLGFALVVGVIVGVLIGWSTVLTHATRVPIEFLKPIPPIVVMPIAVLVLGPTFEMGVFLIFYGCVLPITYQTVNGVKETDPVAMETGRSYGMKQPEILYRIVLPSTSAFIGTAARIALPISLIVAVVAGLLGGGPGLGREIFQAMGAGNQPHLYATVILLGILGLLFQYVGSAVETRLLHWHPTYRAEVN